MILTNPRFWLGAVSLGIVGGLVASSFTRTAPGPISSVHAREQELTGLGSCANCHGGWFGDMTSSCRECHPGIASQIDHGRGLHGSLAPEAARRCGTCHSEHHGAEFQLVNRLSFSLAGVPDPSRFDHARVGYPMAGKHLELACKECHANAEVAVLAKGATRYVGLQQDCRTCHADAHEGRMVIACADCHGQVSFQQLEPRDHDKHLPLVGGHAGLSCRDCHAKDTAHSLEVIGERRAAGPARACADCHESPHRPGFLEATARLAGKAPATACAECHRPAHTSFRAPELDVTPEQHAASGFPLTPPHHELTCSACHDPKLGAFAERHPGRKPDSCVDCHEDVHRGEFEGKPFAANGCIDCHARTHFGPHGFDVQKHAQTAFALDGVHARTDCHACHRQDTPGAPARFRGTATSCQSCHADAHAGYFDRFARELGEQPGGTCAACHVTRGFAELPAEGFDHGRWTGFAIGGAHAQAGCEACHPPAAQADAHGRRFGKVAEKFGKYVGCATCHKDPHGGAFDKPGANARVDGRTSCARCHVDTSFRAFPNGFDHNRWTGFALTGAHGKLACTECHPRLPDAGADGRTWAKARGKHCADCHRDPHAGQFDESGRAACHNCHRSAETFRDLVFRHEVHSRFKLGEQHSKVPCAACHKPFSAGGREVVRYRPLPMQCVDCHGEATTPLPKRNEGRR